MKRIDQLNYTVFVSCVQIGPCILRTLAIIHLTLKFRVHGHFRIQVNLSVNLVAIMMAIAAQTY